MDINQFNSDIQVIEKTLTQVNESSLSESEKSQFLSTKKQISELKKLSEQKDLSTKEKIEFRSNIL